MEVEEVERRTHTWILQMTIHSSPLRVRYEVSILSTAIILCMRPPNERQRYNLMLSLIGWVHVQEDPCE